MTAPNLHVLPSADEAAQAAADWMAALAAEQAQSHGCFTIALSGGSTPRRLLQLLAAPPHAARVAWDRWHVFWSDERCVPPDHQDSNYRMAREALLDHVAIPEDLVHRMRGEAEPKEAARAYESEVRRALQASRGSFDLVMLGLGEDGHVASLFPGTKALTERRRLVTANWAPLLQAHRLTFTLPLINAARNVMLLVTDDAKAEVVRLVLEEDADPPLPAALVRPQGGQVHWFLTQGAAAMLKRSGGGLPS